MTLEASICREFGDREQFSIICAHEPFGEEPRHVFGRMCIRAGDKSLGDFGEPACMLNVTASHLQGVLRRLPDLANDGFGGMSDSCIWDTIDKAVYQGDDRSMQEVAADAEKFFKFDFLTNGGESFDKSKSFIVREGDNVRLLFVEDGKAMDSIVVNEGMFRGVVQDFLDWIDSGGA